MHRILCRDCSAASNGKFYLLCLFVESLAEQAKLWELVQMSIVTPSAINTALCLELLDGFSFFLLSQAKHGFSADND